MTRYLSLAWIDAVAAEIAASDPLRELAADHEIGITQVVTAGPEGDVTYHLQVGGGVVEFGAGSAEPEDVRMEQAWGTAIAVATGTLSAQEAFMSGKILLFGDQQKLLGAQPVFGALDAVFTAVADQTEYA